jgi:putative ABC transport system substrate-binding protein
MNRREFIAGLGSAAAWPIVARAQHGERMRRVGVLMNNVATDTEYQSYVTSFVQGLRQLRWIEGENLRLDIRWSGGDAGLARLYAAQLIGLMPDVILASSTTNLMVIRQATSTVPVVFLQISDPVAQGFVESMRRPGGNLTGFSTYEFSVGGKWLDLLKEVMPGLARVAVMFNPDTSPQSKFFAQAIEAAAPSHGVQTFVVPVRASTDIEPALAAFAHQPSGGLLLPTDTFTILRYSLIADLASRYSLPSISAQSGFVKDGGLMEYGNRINYVDQYRQAAGYIDRILRGEKPADLPVQAPTKYQTVINLKTAKALGLTIPETLLATADEIIQCRAVTSQV